MHGGVKETRSEGKIAVSKHRGRIEIANSSLSLSAPSEIYIRIYFNRGQVSPIDLLWYIVQFTTRYLRIDPTTSYANDATSARVLEISFHRHPPLPRESINVIHPALPFYSRPRGFSPCLTVHPRDRSILILKRRAGPSVIALGTRVFHYITRLSTLSSTLAQAFHRASYHSRCRCERNRTVTETRGSSLESGHFSVRELPREESDGRRRKTIRACSSPWSEIINIPRFANRAAR